jgi:light-regulated signal transduction histidine kinase (bacteriophytochrome)
MKPSVDLTNCDREPIHIPGSIQPHGCLIACDAGVSRVLRHSVNAPQMLGIDGELNGRMLDTIVGPDATHTLRNALLRASDAARAALTFGLRLPSGGVFDVAIHRFRGNVIIEFEPAEVGEQQPLELTRALIGRVANLDTVDRLTTDTARLVRGMFGYDRVMVYKFAHDGSGKVVSESKRGDLESFLGQHFPASDIPQQARALYLSNTIRIISDANFERIPIAPEFDASGEALDLSYAHLRSVSPVHCEYLRNMGVSASMSISVIVEGALWGMIACHHYAPRRLSMAERVAAEMFGEFFSLHLGALKQRQKLEAATFARQALASFLRVAVRSTGIDETLRDSLETFRSLIPCDGVGIWLNGRWSGAGVTPPESDIRRLAVFAADVAEGRVWATHALDERLPGAGEGVIAGVLTVPLSRRPRDYLFFFRKELTQTLEWAGNPEKSYGAGPLGDRLTPRKSFAIWKETVHRQAEPWSDEEREIAEAARVALVEVALHHSELLEDERAKADVRQRMLNEELNHRVKNILAVIKSLVTSSAQDGRSLESYIQSLRGRIQALAFAHDQIVRGDGGGALGDLVGAELSPYRDDRRSVEIAGANVWLDARAFSVMALVLHELSTNAAKYGALSRGGGRLRVGWTLDETGACVIDWRESGGPPVHPPARQGFGTVLIDRSIPFDLGGESDVEYRPEGLTARFVIPARHVAETAAAPAQNRRAAQPLRGPLAENLAGLKVLLVEDQMLIAMDLEQILLQQGISDIATAGSVADALSRLQAFSPDIAILDVNLGAENSLPAADELVRRGIPFLFATGYGDGSMIPERFASRPIVRKPYEAASIVSQILALLKRN